MMVCEICGSEHKDSRGFNAHMRIKHPQNEQNAIQNTQTTGKSVLQNQVRSAREIVAEYLDVKLQLRLAKDLDHLDDQTLQAIVSGESEEKKDPFSDFKSQIELMNELKNLMPQETTGKSWADILSEALPTIKEAIMGLNNKKAATPKETKGGEVKEITPLEAEILEKENKLKEDKENELGRGRSKETTTEGIGSSEGVSSEITPTTTGNGGTLEEH